MASFPHVTTMGVILLILAAFDLAYSFPNYFGKDFITAFPENIAFYHPTQPDNRIIVTALESDTWVTVTMKDPGFQETQNLAAGQPYEFLSNRNGTELARSKFSNQTLHVTSTNYISVLAISQRGDSIQTIVVPPVQTLDTEYHIPPIPNMIQSQIDPENSSVTDSPLQPQTDLHNSLFRLIIINHNTYNNVTVSGPAGSNETVSLQPFQLVQLWVNGSLSEQCVLADFPVAVLFGHPCAATTNCTCRFLVSPLYPVSAWGVEYLMPSLENKTSNETTFLLTTNQTVTLLSGPPNETLQLHSSQELPFYPSLPGGSVLVKTSSPVFLTLYSPGRLLNLIPTASFSSCYLIYTLEGQNNQALLIVPTAQTNGVHLESTALNLTWTPMSGTGYFWGLADLGTEGQRHIVWHNSSKMAVYHLGESNSTFFGNPATSLSTDPDSKGCLLRPGIVKLSNMQQGWPESLNYCQNLGYHLVSLTTQDVLLSIAKTLRESKVQAHGQGWIGLRRSSLTGQWYWLTKQNVLFTHWGMDEPGTPMEGQCAMMTLDPHGNYTWSDQSCCEALSAVCYSEPIYFTLQ